MNKIKVNLKKFKYILAFALLANPVFSQQLIDYNMEDETSTTFLSASWDTTGLNIEIPFSEDHMFTTNLEQHQFTGGIRLSYGVQISTPGKWNFILNQTNCNHYLDGGAGNSSTGLFVYLWTKDQFLNDATSNNVVFDNTPGSQLSFTATNIQGNSKEFRFVIRNGDTYYLSEYMASSAGTLILDSFGSSSEDGKGWAAFDPASLQMPDPMPSFSAVDFDDVRAVGFIYKQYKSEYGHQFSFTDFDVKGIVERETDSEAPTPPSDLKATAVLWNRLNLEWSKSTDNIGVKGYTIYANNDSLTSVTDTMVTLNGINPSTEYKIYVRAFDAWNNLSVPGDTIDITTQDENYSYVQNIGVNIGTPGGQVDYDALKTWADAMRTHRQWGKPGTSVYSEPVSLDEKGWPLEDASCLVYHGLTTNNNYGSYKLIFECNDPENVNVTENWGGGVLQDKTISGNIVSYNLVISNVNNSQMLLIFTNTNGGVRNVKLMRPLSPGSTESYPEGTIFTSTFGDAIKPFKTLRFMQWMAGDSPLEHINWDDRTPWDNATMNAKSLYSWGARGPAWETVLMVANTYKKDAWIVIPVRATDAYVRSLAELFRDGNEFTEGLDPELKLYIEFGNEIWNSGTYGKQWNYVKSAGAASAECTYDGETDQNTLAHRYTGKRIVEISNIFREVFGNDQMQTRIRPYLGHQKGYFDIENRTISFVDKYYCGGDPESTWTNHHPMYYYIYAWGGSCYYSPADVPPALTIDNIWNNGEFNMDLHRQKLSVDAAIARTFGLKYIQYEGGQHPRYNGDETVTREAAVDPRMYLKQIEQHHVNNNVDAEMSVYFTLANGEPSANPGITAGHFGILRGDVGNTNRPRYNAFAELAETERQPVSIGRIPPFIIDGKNYDIIDKGWLEAGNGSQVLNRDSYYTGYMFRVEDQDYYTISVEYSSANLALLQIQVEGKTIKALELSGSGQTSPVHFRCNVNKLYSFKLACTRGNVSIDKITVLKSIDNPDEEPPSQPELSVSGLSGTSCTLNWTESSDNVAVEEYYLYRNGVLINVSVGLELEISGLTSMTDYTFSIVAVDEFGNMSQPYSLSVNSGELKDTEAPGMPLNLRVSDITENSCLLSWDASSDNVGVDRYEIFNGADPEGSTTGLSMEITGLEASTGYSFYVKAVDAANNMSEPAVIEVTTSNPMMIEKNNTGNAISIFPNPVSGQSFEIEWNMPGSGEFDVEIMDMEGRVAGHWSLRTGHLSIDAGFLPAGVYLVRVISGDSVSASRLVVN